MFKLGCNWSEPLYELLTSKQTDVDYIKTGAFGAFDTRFGAMRALRPVLLHCLGHYERAGMNNIEIVDFERANRLIAECGSPHYGLHLCITNADRTPSMTEDDIERRMSESIQLFKRKLHVPLLIENIPETPQEKVLYDHYPYAEPEKISRAVLDNDVGFLLDLTHAKITALYKKWDIHDYLNAMPLQRIKEIHVNGSGFDAQGFPDDTHHPMGDEDYALLEWVLERTNPEVVSLEYVGVEGETAEEVSETLLSQLKRLRTLSEQNHRG